MERTSAGLPAASSALPVRLRLMAVSWCLEPRQRTRMLCARCMNCTATAGSARRLCTPASSSSTPAFSLFHVMASVDVAMRIASSSSPASINARVMVTW